MKYLLPCNQCDTPIQVSTTDAGRSVHCSHCGTDQQAPSLGKIKALPVAEGGGPTQVRVRKWSRLQGFAFGVGLILIISAGVMLSYYVPNYLAAKKDLDRLTAEITSELGEKALDFEDTSDLEEHFRTAPVGQLWVERAEVTRLNTDRYFPDPYRVVANTVESNHQSIVFHGCILLAGLLAVAVSFFLP